jgi:hypothetical protein
MAIFAFYEERNYRVGDTMDVDILVFNKTAPYDPYNVTFFIGFLFGRYVNVTRQNVGVYNTTFTIEADDLFLGVLVIDAEAVEGEGFYADSASDGAYIAIYTPSLDVDVTIPDTEDNHPSPGQEVDIEIAFEYNGVPVDPDTGTINAYVENSTGYKTSIVPIRKMVGFYEATFTVPSDQKVSEEFEVAVEAEYTDGGDTVDGDHSIYFEVELFSVWINVVDATPTGAEVDVYAMDGTGQVQKGADVYAHFLWYTDSGADIDKHMTGTTDAFGKATFDVEFNMLGEEEKTVEVDGAVKANGIVQTFEGEIAVRTDLPVSPHGYGLDVILLNSIPLPLDTLVDLNFLVFNGESLLTNTDIYTYITDRKEIHYKGIVSTDAQGKFTVSVTTPSSVPKGEPLGSAYMGFQAEISGEWDWDDGQLYFGDVSLRGFFEPYLSTSTTMTVAPFEQGGSVEVILDDPAADGIGETASVIWGLGSIDHWDLLLDVQSPKWASWTGGDFVYTRSVPCTWSDGAWHATFPFPRFVPTSVDVFFVGSIEFDEDLTPNPRIAVIEGRNALPGNELPTVTITTPTKGVRYSGTLVIAGTAADDTAVTVVELRLDGGAWFDATGTTEWTYELDTATLSSGSHTVQARAYDGEDYSEIAIVVFTADQPPLVTIATPTEGERYHDTFEATGSASDDQAVTKVEVRIDAGDWASSENVAPWSYSVDTKTLSQGTHTLEARALDGVSTSPVVSVEFIVDQLPSVTVTSPEEAMTYSGTLEVAGTATDDVSVERVEVRVVPGTWSTVEGSTTWTYELDTTSLSTGTHTLDARSYDGYEYSAVASVSFDVDQPPGVADLSLEVDVLYAGMLNITGSASDDVEVLKVEVRVDEGQWRDATGTTSWWYELDTTTIDQGDHLFEVRTYDGARYSDVLNVTFKVDQPPTVTITVPVEAEMYKKRVEMAGTAADDAEVLWVEFNLDGGEWTKAEGTANWIHELNLKDLEKGNHTVEFRSWDGNTYSEVVSVTFKVEEEKKDDGPGFGLPMVILGLLSVSVLLLLRRR